MKANLGNVLRKFVKLSTKQRTAAIALLVCLALLSSISIFPSQSNVVAARQYSRSDHYYGWSFPHLTTPTTTPTATPTPTVKPTTTPTPTPSPTSTTSTTRTSNVAAFNDENWYTDVTWTKIPAGNVAWETSTTHNGALTLKVTPDFTNGNSGADHDGLTVHPGDHIVMSVWIKTGGSVPVSYAGARMGMDVYGSTGRITGVHSVQQASDGCRSTTGIDENYVHWGSDWTLVTWDFVMPATYISDGGSASISNNYANGQAVTPATIIPWIQVWDANYPNNAYTCYFSDFQVHINP